MIKRALIYPLLCLAFLLTIPAKMQAQAVSATFGYETDMKAHYKIYDVKQKQIIDLNKLVQEIKPYQVLFFGEEHNDSTAHYLQYQLYKQLFQVYGNQVAVSFEMFHTDVQPVMDEYIQGIISEKNFLKESRPWNNYKDYKPLVEFAKQNKLQVIAANASARYSNAVTRDGLEILNKLPKDSKKFLPQLPIDTATGAYYKKFTDLLGGHSMGPMKVYQSQNLWDATMAWSISEFLKKHKTYKVFHLNGRFHTDEKLGTFAQLKKYGPKLKAANIACFSAEDFNNPDWEKYAMLGDYIIVTDPGVKKTF